ncbi:MAG: hypothetical protein V4478_01135 [Patescibacteria group bacterium]
MKKTIIAIISLAMAALSCNSPSPDNGAAKARSKPSIDTVHSAKTQEQYDSINRVRVQKLFPDRVSYRQYNAQGWKPVLWAESPESLEKVLGYALQTKARSKRLISIAMVLDDSRPSNGNIDWIACKQYYSYIGKAADTDLLLANNDTIFIGSYMPIATEEGAYYLYFYGTAYEKNSTACKSYNLHKPLSRAAFYL